MKREASRTVQPPKDGESASSALSAASPGLRTPRRHMHTSFRACHADSRTPSSPQAPCFHIVARSFARRKTPTSVFSIVCALFGKNTGGGYPPLLTPNFPTRSALFAHHRDAHSATLATALNPSRAVVYHARRTKSPTSERFCTIRNSPVGDSTYIFRRPHGRALEVG